MDYVFSLGGIVCFTAFIFLIYFQGGNPKAKAYFCGIAAVFLMLLVDFSGIAAFYRIITYESGSIHSAIIVGLIIFVYIKLKALIKSKP